MSRDRSIPSHGRQRARSIDAAPPIFRRLQRAFRARTAERLQSAPCSKLLLCGEPGWNHLDGALAFSRRVMLPLQQLQLRDLAGSGLTASAQLDAFLKAVDVEADGAPKVSYLADIQLLLENEELFGGPGQCAHLCAGVSLFVSRNRPAGFVVSTLDVHPHMDLRPWLMFDDLVWRSGAATAEA